MSKLTSNSGEVDTKAALVEVITSILKDPPSPNDDESLINQGLDSISTVTVISSLSTMLGKDMPNIADFLRSPTIGDWVKVIDGKVEEVRVELDLRGLGRMVVPLVLKALSNPSPSHPFPPSD
jgi:aryl carrier-like protein